VRGPKTSADVLALQRLVGNRATGVLLGRVAQRSIQRRLVYGPDFLGGTGAIGKVKALAGQSTYTKIRETLEEYRAERKAGGQLWLLKTMLALIIKWTNANASSKSAGNLERKRKLSLLGQAIHTEIPLAEEQAQYMRDMEKPEGKFDYMSMSAPMAVDQARELAEGKTTGSSGQTPEALELMQKYDVSDAEMAAIKTYSVDDFKYINPALADNDAWLAAQIPKVLSIEKKDVSPAGLKKATAEGKRHGAMALTGLKKLPVWSGPTFRGLRRTKAELDKDYVPGTQTTAKPFQSTSLEQSVAERFAKKTEDDSKVGLVCHLKITNGRDIAKLSLLGDEKEILLLPGATMTIETVTPRPGTKPGEEIYDVVMTQTA
jgi:hypothetical protein